MRRESVEFEVKEFAIWFNFLEVYSGRCGWWMQGDDSGGGRHWESDQEWQVEPSVGGVG